MIYKFQNSGIIPQVDATRVALNPREYKGTTIQQDHDAIVKWNLEHPNDKVYRIEDLIQKEKEANPSWVKRAGNLAVNPIPTSNYGMMAAPNPNSPVRSTVKDELGIAMAAATVPMIGSEIGLYRGLGTGLRFGAGSAAAAGASYAGGKTGDWLDNKLGSNWIGDTSRLVLPFITFPAGMKGANSILRSAAGHGITMRMPQETFTNLRNQYFTNAGNKALVNLNSKSNPTLTSTINHLYKEYPELSSIGPKEAYRQYYETIFPASKVQTPYAHGTKSDLSGGLETSVKIPNAAAPETIGRNDFYLNLQPEASLQYADGIGVPKGFTWNKHRFWPLKEILGKPYKSDAWMSEPIKLREQIPNRAGQFSRVKNADGTYFGHGKLLEEYKAELGMQDLSNEEFLQRLGVQNEESFNQWVAKNRQMFSDIYDSGDYHGLYHVKIDANKPLTINGGDTYYSERGIWDRMNKGGNDVLLHNNAANEFGSDVAVVRDVTPQRVRILGSKPDQQGFVDFMGGKQQFFTEIPTSPQEAATTYHFDGRMPLSKPISEAERLGIPKASRSTLNSDQTEAIDDLLWYLRNGRHKKYFLYNPETETFRWSSSKAKDGEIGAVRALIEHGATSSGYYEGAPVRLSNEYGNFTIWPNKNAAFTSNFPIPEGMKWGPGETSLMLEGDHSMKTILTSPRVDLSASMEDAPIELVNSLPNTIDKSIMRRFWSENDKMIRPGTYLSGDNGQMPLGNIAISAFDRTKSVNSAIQSIINPKNARIGRTGLSPDSYSSIIRQGLRGNHKLRWGEGFTKWNDSAVENRAIYEAWKKMNAGEITPEQYKQIFDDWAIPLGGRPVEIRTTPSFRTITDNNGIVRTIAQEPQKYVVMPHPYIMYRKQGGKI